MTGPMGGVLFLVIPQSFSWETNLPAATLGASHEALINQQHKVSPYSEATNALSLIARTTSTNLILDTSVCPWVMIGWPSLHPSNQLQIQ